MRLRLLPFTVVVAASLVLGSCSSSKDDNAAPGTTAAGAGSTTTAEPAPVGPTSDRELEALLVTAVPARFALQPDDVGDTGPSDLAKAIRDDPTPGTEEALRSEGFVRGYQRYWAGPSDAELVVFVYQFETPAGATADFLRGKGVLSAGMPRGSTPFTVDGIPAGDSRGIIGSSPDMSVAIVQFTTGVFNVQVTCNGPAAAGLQERASTIAKDQYDRL